MVRVRCCGLCDAEALVYYGRANTFVEYEGGQMGIHNNVNA